MPWRIASHDQRCPITRPFAVVREDTGAMVACHPTRGDAEAHMRALYANEPEARDSDETPPAPTQLFAAAEDVRADKQPADRYPDSEGPFAGPNNTFPLNTAARVRNAWARIHQGPTMANHTPAEIASIKAKIRARAKELGIQLEEDSATSNRADDTPLEDKPHAKIETRDAEVKDVNFAERIITVIAAPYEQPAIITYRGELYKESFERTAWDGLRGKRPTMVRANRDHDKSRTVGKVINLYPEREEGLVAEIRCAKTALGDETLALADEDCISSSVGFGVLPDGQLLDRRTKTRRIKTAHLDHIAFVESPAYAGAAVIGVRANGPDETNEYLHAVAKLMTMIRDTEIPAERRRNETPNLDQFADDDIFRWASERLRNT